MKQKKPLSNRRKTLRNLCLIFLAAASIGALSLLDHQYTPQQAARYIEQKELLRPTHIAATGTPDASQTQRRYKHWQIRENDNALLFTLFYTAADARPVLPDLHCSYVIIPNNASQMVCAEICQVHPNLYVFGRISDSTARRAEITLTIHSPYTSEHTAVVTLDTSAMTLHESSYYFAVPADVYTDSDTEYSYAETVSVAEITLTMRDGTMQTYTLPPSQADVGSI